MPLVYLRELITAYDLLKRWEKEVTEERLASLMRNKALQAYRLPSPPVPRKPGDQHDAYEPMSAGPEKALVHHFFDISGTVSHYNYSGVVFNMAEIVAYEVKHLGQKEQPILIQHQHGIPDNNCNDDASTKPKSYARGFINQDEAAKMCGVSKRTFQDLEKGKKQCLIEEPMPSRYKLKEFVAWADRYFRALEALKAGREAQRKAPGGTKEMDMKAYSDYLWEKDKL